MHSGAVPDLTAQPFKCPDPNRVAFSRAVQDSSSDQLCSRGKARGGGGEHESCGGGGRGGREEVKRIRGSRCPRDRGEKGEAS